MGYHKLGESMKCSRKQLHRSPRAGFTLIELVVVMAVTAVVMSALVGLFVIAGNTAAHQNLVTDAHTAAIQIEQQIETRTRYADSVNLYVDGAAAGAATPTDTTGTNAYLCIGGSNNNALAVNTYSGTAWPSTDFSPTGSAKLTFALKFEKTADASVQITITVKDKTTANMLYTVSTDLHFDNLALSGTSSVGVDSTSFDSTSSTYTAYTALAYHVAS